MAPNTKNSDVPFTEIEPSDNPPSSRKNIKEILVDGYYYDVTEWSRLHPGGRIIEYYTENGEDASAAVQQFHLRSRNKVKGIMSSLRKRPAQLLELGRAELDFNGRRRHEALTQDFNELFIQLEREGYFKPCIWHMTYRLLELLTLVSVGVYLCQKESWILKLIGIASSGMFFGRVGWFEHEAGHHSFTGNSKVDRWLQMVVVGIGAGLSSSYWSLQHNRHHAMPQRLQKDVDLNTMPLLAFNVKVTQNQEKGQKPNFFVRHQAILFLAIDTLIVAILWKLFLHPRYSFRKKKYGQLFWMGLHYVIAYQMGFFEYWLSAWLTSIYMFGNFSLSHTHLPVSEEPRHWVEYGLLHTMDIESTPLCDWWMGFLNCQIEHHLFPTMPQFRNRLVKDRVKVLAAKHGIPYQCCSYWEAVGKTFRNLEQVSRELGEM